MCRARGRRLKIAALGQELWRRTRFVAIFFSIAIGVLMFFFGPQWLHGTVRYVAAYDIGAFALLCFDWGIGLRNDKSHTERRAAQEDPGRWIVSLLIVFSVLAGLASAIVILGTGPAVPKSDRGIALFFGIAAVALGWILIHTTFIFRYAHLFYYDSDEDGCADHGLQFPGTTEPDDYDFAYFSFVIGMTFQVSDVQITDSGLRLIVLQHAIISFVYNTAIVALGVNLASSLLNAH